MKKVIYLFIILSIFLIYSCGKKKTYFTATFIVDDVVTTKDFEKGEMVTFPIVDNDYIVEGWYVDGNLVNNYIINSDVTFTAKLCLKQYVVKLIVNDELYDEINVDYYEIYELPEVSSVGYYKIIGWDLVSGDKYSMIDDLEYKAITEFDPMAKLGEIINIPDIVNSNIDLPTSFEDALIRWSSSNSEYLDSNGKLLKQGEVNIKCNLNCEITVGDKIKTYLFSVIIEKMSDEDILNNIFDNYEFSPSINSGKLELDEKVITNYYNLSFVWESGNTKYIDNDGYILTYPLNDMIIPIIATLQIKDTVVSRTFDYNLLGFSDDELFDFISNTIKVPKYVTTNHISLPNDFPNGITGVWSSSDESIIGADGVVKKINFYNVVKLTLTLSDGDNMKKYDYDVTLNPNQMLFKAKELDEECFNNLTINDNHLELITGATYGEYVSKEIDAIEFNEIIPSWSAYTSKDATIEFQISVNVGGTWSKYFVYCEGGFGLGLENKLYDQSDSLCKLVDDELKVNGSILSKRFKFKVILRRTTTSVSSPSISLISFALVSPNYDGFNGLMEDLPSYVKYDVPRLRQGIVPEIGGSICSPTSTTMLLKYKGLSFVEKDQYEHRYIANLAKDYGNNIFGNWIFNCLVLGSYGYDAYVARFNNLYELCYHLANVGPVAINVKGVMTSSEKTYTTNGHLICIIGYTYENGVLTFISNDPNVVNVECCYTANNISSTWKRIAYVIL